MLLLPHNYTHLWYKILTWKCVYREKNPMKALEDGKCFQSAITRDEIKIKYVMQIFKISFPYPMCSMFRDVIKAGRIINEREQASQPAVQVFLSFIHENNIRKIFKGNFYSEHNWIAVAEAQATRESERINVSKNDILLFILKKEEKRKTE